MNKKNFKTNDLQRFAKENQSQNVIVIGSTGIGKTEAALLWSNHDKTFFTLPLRISINAIYDRIKETIGYNHVGLLHSTAVDYLDDKNKDSNNSGNFDEIKDLVKDTIDDAATQTKKVIDVDNKKVKEGDE